MSELPAAFHAHQNPVTNLALDPWQESSRWTEFVAHMAHFSDADVPDTHTHLQLLLEQEAHPARRAILLAGVARCQLHQGDFIAGPQTLGYAYSLTGEGDGDARAFILMEMAAFMAITAQYELALMLLSQTHNLTHSTYLHHLRDYYWAVLKGRKGASQLIQKLTENARYFDSIGDAATLAYHYKNIGNAHRRQQEFIQAEDHYNRALSLASDNRYGHIAAAVLHDLGMLRYHQGRFPEAISFLEDALEQADSPYTVSFTLGNMGYLYKAKKQLDKAVLFLQRSLNIASENGVFFIIPTITCNLGDCHQQLGNHDLTRFFYKQGYETGKELLNHHFPYNGDRKRVMESYVNLLTVDQPNQTSTPSADLSFTLDKTLQQIRSIFQGSLLSILQNNFGSATRTAAELGIARRTFFTARERSAQYYSGTPNPFVQQFLERQVSTDWKTLNQEFDREMLSYLYQEYGRNKRVLSEKLAVSYPYLVNLTRRLEVNSSLPLKSAAHLPALRSKNGRIS